MAKQWTYKHGENTIRVENTSLSESLFVNGELQDKNVGVGFRSTLRGRLPSGEEVKVSIGGTWFTMQCCLFVDHKLLSPEDRYC